LAQAEETQTMKTLLFTNDKRILYQQSLLQLQRLLQLLLRLLLPLLRLVRRLSI
jgi:hypothetical protein